MYNNYRGKNMTHYRIFQLQNIHDCLYAFMPWAAAKRYISLEDYKMVYEGEIQAEDPDKALEELFIKFNTNHPNDFKGHSLSVSDLVEIGDKLYYCDSTGWEEITYHF